MVIRTSSRGKFLGCSGYPKCKNAKPLPEDEKSEVRNQKSEIPADPPATAKPAPQMTDEKCEKCGKPMVVRKGRFGEFLGCSGYPACKNIKKLAKT
jgi:DNA topoisomerase-1